MDMKYETIKHTYDRDAYADAIWERKSVSELAIRKSSLRPMEAAGQERRCVVGRVKQVAK